MKACYAPVGMSLSGPFEPSITKDGFRGKPSPDASMPPHPP